MAEETKQEAQPQKKGAVTSRGALLLAGFVVLGLLGYAGLSMVGLQSQAGNTVAEAYYQASGWLALGLALFCASVLWALAALVGRR